LDHIRAFWTWTLVGALVAGMLIATQVSAVGGISGLLQVGEVSPLRPAIEGQLGEVPLVHHVGHDGQIFYAMGLDLTGETIGPLFDDPAYRYRRILFPAVSSMFGFLDGQALLVGMIVTVVISAALATGAVAATARLLGRSQWLALAVVANPGIWLSIRLLTPEVVAIAFMALGLMAFLLRSRSTSLAFSLSALTKEAFVLTALGVAFSRDRRRWIVGVVPAGVLLAWSVWGQISLGGFQGESNNLSLPLTGIIEAAAIWPRGGFEDWFYLIFGLCLVGVAVILGLIKRGWLRWSLLGWGLLGLCSSWFVWRIGNNAARVFAPILVLIVLHGQLSSEEEEEESTDRSEPGLDTRVGAPHETTK
jgi:hypothetical protein